MAAMTEPGPPPADAAAEPPPAPAGPVPGERRLDHPPSDRYRAAELAAQGTPRPTSVARGLGYAAIVVVLGALAITVLGGIVTLTGGLLALAAIIGWATAWALRTGGGATIAASRRTWLAIALALALGSIVLGQIGLWLYGLTEGGVLPLVDYLGEVFGPLVPAQAFIAAVVAWVAAR
jgi:hypothetical protein